MKILSSALILLCLSACGIKSSSAPTPPIYCESQASCPPGYQCLITPPANTCKRSCERDSECGDGSRCDAGVCTAIVQDMAGSDADPSRGGCSDGKGRPVYPDDPFGIRQWLCPGVFGAGQIYGRCGIGYTLCTTTLISNTSTCTNAAGFFISGEMSHAPNVPPPDSATVCDHWDGAPATDQRFLHGCGTSGGVYDFPTQPCNGFRHAINCKNGSKGSPASSFTCPASGNPGDADLMNVTNTDPNNGVTCCKIGA